MVELVTFYFLKIKSVNISIAAHQEGATHVQNYLHFSNTIYDMSQILLLIHVVPQKV